MSWREDLSRRAAGMELSPEELRRYSRHLVIPEIGLAGQQRLKAARILIVGVGGLGSPAAAYLAAAGVGELGLADPDAVSLSNLQRQILFREEDVGRSKVRAAAECLSARNPGVRIIPFEEKIGPENIAERIEAFDLVIDGTDNFSVRYLLNDACFFSGRPLVHGSLFRFDGRVAVFHADSGGPCYRCLQPEPPDPGTVPTCAEGGVMGALAGFIGSMQAMEAIKCVCGAGDSPGGKLWRFDAMRNRFRAVTLQADPECPLCGKSPDIKSIEQTASRPECRSSSSDACTFQPASTVRDLCSGHEAGKLLDIRSARERQVQPIKAALTIALADLPDRINELDSSRPLAVICSGSERTRQAIQLLKDAGFQNVVGVDGGVDAWLEES